MIRPDYTLALYEDLLDAAVDAGYAFATIEDVLTGSEPDDPHVVVRHDVDRRPRNALLLARAEADRGISATYYFRTGTATPERLARVESLGHEVGYHYEDFVRAGGDHDRAHALFAETLASFREHATIRTVAGHGNLSRYTNIDLWDRGPSFADYDLAGDACRSMDLHGTYAYRSDTDRRWGAAGEPETTPELIAELEAGELDRVAVLAHPSRWTTDALEYVYQLGWDAAATSAKRAVRGTARIGTATARVREAAP
ncbi:hypothetical protein [Saliphagus infecundisoli]|uniref:Polysaccharide deacetylase n=1 Tax=Saliphagus infecundisoli TaxID=1849069 RepID=A0ABD5QK94_9EURY|nr:hypothetical protein [Saliphagus infecundisoli]